MSRETKIRWDGTGFPARLATAKGALSANAFAKKCGLSESVFRKYLAGESIPGADKLVDIAREAAVSVDWLATGRTPTAMAKAANDTVAGVDAALLETVIDAVEAGLEQIGATLPPARKAKLIASLYGIYQASDEARRAPVLELVRLAV